jgi:hypothetical protein
MYSGKIIYHKENMKMYDSMKETMNKALMEDKNCHEIKGPCEAPDEWKLFKNDPPTGDIDHFYVSFVKEGTEESIVFDACLQGLEVMIFSDMVFAPDAKEMYGEKMQIYWKKAEAKEKEK